MTPKVFFEAEPILPEERSRKLETLLAIHAHFRKMNDEIAMLTKMPRIRVLYPHAALGGLTDGTLRFGQARSDVRGEREQCNF